MSENAGTPGVDIPLSIDTQPAEQHIRSLESAAEQLDDRLARLQQRTISLGNNERFSDFGGYTEKFKSYDELEEYVNRTFTPEQLWARSPRLAQSMQEVEAQRGAIGANVARFVDANPGADLTSRMGAYQAYQTWLARAPEAAASTTAAPPTPATPGTSATPPPPATPPTPANAPETPQQADRLGTAFANALRRTSTGLLTSGLGAASSAAGLGAAGDIAAAGLSHGLVGALGDALGSLLFPVTAGLAAAGLGLAANQMTTTYLGEQRTLAGAVGGAPAFNPNPITPLDVGWSYQYHAKDTMQAAETLGAAGVSTPQLPGALRNAMALAGVSNLDLPTTTNVTAGLVQAGMSNDQILQYYAHLKEASDDSGVAMDRLVRSLQDLTHVAGLGQTSITGLTAAQHAIDQIAPGLGVSSVLGGALGQTGASALQAAAILGLTPAQFTRAQGDPAQMLDAYARLARRYDVGPAGTQIAEEMMSAAGFDFSGMKGNEAQTFIQKLIAQGPQAAEQYEQTLVKKEPKAGTDTQPFLDLAHVFRDNVTPAADQAAIALERLREQAAQGLVDPRHRHQGATTDNTPENNRYGIRATSPDETTVPGSPARVTVPRPAPTPRHFDPNALGLGAAERQGIQVMDASGRLTYGSGSIITDIAEAAHRAHLSQADTAELMAKAANDSGFNPLAVHKDGSRGLFQFTDAATSHRYLVDAAYTLGLPRQAQSDTTTQLASDPRIDALAAALYGHDLLAQTGGNWTRALAMSVGGPHPNQAAQQYAAHVGVSADEVRHHLQIDVTVHDDKGRPQAHTTTHHTVTTHGRPGVPLHGIDHERTPVAHQSYYTPTPPHRPRPAS